MTDDTERPWTMSLVEAARKYYGIKSKDLAYAAGRDGTIPCVRVGRVWRALPRVIERELGISKKPTEDRK